jgi:hypothetical protein
LEEYIDSERIALDWIFMSLIVDDKDNFEEREVDISS